MIDVLQYYSKSEISKYRTAYRFQKSCAINRRNIPWNISFIEWLSVWHESNKLSLRGKRAGCYQMGRYGDTGPYEIGNVIIISMRENLQQARGKPVVIDDVAYSSITSARIALGLSKGKIYRKLAQQQRLDK